MPIERTLDKAVVCTAGYDVTEVVEGVQRKIQIEGRRIIPGSVSGKRFGAIDIEKPFDAVLLVVLNENLDAVDS